jgi:hypothetical protein
MNKSKEDYVCIKVSYVYLSPVSMPHLFTVRITERDRFVPIPSK